MEKIESNPPSKFQAYLKLSCKLLFVSGLLYFLLSKGFLSLQATQQALQQWDHIIPAFIATLVAAFLGVVRWQWLLKAHDIEMKWNRAFQLTFIGNFFNIALPGAISGDFVKAFYVGQETKGNKTRAFGSILFDRVAGLSALVLVSAGALVLGFNSFLNTAILAGIGVFLGVSAAAVFIFYAYLFLVQEHHDPLLRLFRWLEKKIPQTSALTNIYTSLRHYHRHRWTVIKVLFLSTLIHLMIGWASLEYARALGESHLALLPIYLVVPLGLLITAVPVAPAGVGTGNIAFLYLFQLIGSSRGADTFSLMALANIIIGGVGGLIYFRFRAHEPELSFDAVPSEITT